ncbi:MAG TPA: cation-translocating P-type ATPase, partial [Holophagaceae bacterium]|nr:cation-translocating P-type ATPase [Holophagaceae bacterium]
AWRGGELPPLQHDFDFTFLGLVGLLDPPRPEVPAALEECRAAGIRVLMLTGDHPRTAEAIARRIGLPPGAALTGAEVDRLDDTALAERLRGAALCARMKPEQKLRLVRALMASGEVVAMTGDGVNDAPALRAAHIGVAMGQRGTDVAREAADLVLVDDSFGSLVGAIREGRRIYDNLSRSVGFIFAVHVPVLGLALIPLALRWAPPLLPVHIALLEMLINPACSVVLEGEPAAPGLMARPPRDPEATPFSGAALRAALLRGGGLLAVLLATQAAAVQSGLAPAAQRTRILLPLILGSFLQILAHRRAGRGPLKALTAPNPRITWTGLAVGLFLVAAVAWTPLQRLLELAPPTAEDAAWGLGAALVFLAWLELLARLERPR